jgi:hypothetical protein
VSSDIVRRRAEIEAVIAGRTLRDELRHVAEASGAAGAYSGEDEAGSRSLTSCRGSRRSSSVTGPPARPATGT